MVYHSMSYVNGTTCDLTEQPRRTVVKVIIFIAVRLVGILAPFAAFLELVWATIIRVTYLSFLVFYTSLIPRFSHYTMSIIREMEGKRREWKNNNRLWDSVIMYHQRCYQIATRCCSLQSTTASFQQREGTLPEAQLVKAVAMAKEDLAFMSPSICISHLMMDIDDV